MINPIDNLSLSKINWVIVGGESGPGARPVKKDWIINIQKACKKNKVPFFFKQWGKSEFNSDPLDPTKEKSHPMYAKGGCQLDGKVYRQMPVSVTKLI